MFCAEDRLTLPDVSHGGKQEQVGIAWSFQCCDDGSQKESVHSSILVKILQVTSVFWLWSPFLWSVEIALLSSSHPPSYFPVASYCLTIFSVWVHPLAMSDSLQLHGRQPTRLLCPWNSPGKCTGVSCHSVLQGIFPTQVSCFTGGFSNMWATREAHTNPELQLGNCLKMIQEAHLVTSDQKRAWVQLQPFYHVSETYWIIIWSCPPERNTSRNITGNGLLVKDIPDYFQRPAIVPATVLTAFN